MSDPFNAGFKGFFGVFTAIVILVLTFTLILRFSSQRKRVNEYERKERIKSYHKEYLKNFAIDALTEDFK